jgi:acetyl esterase
MNAPHPQIAALLAGPLAGPAEPVLPRDAQTMRDGMEAAVAALTGPPEPVDTVADADANGVPVRVYTPAGARGVVLLMHGGGWVIGSLDSHDQFARMLANRACAHVVSVGYRLAPEHPFPAGLNDCRTALDWTRKRFPGVPVAVAGDSAGGNLAAVLARHHRDLRLQALVYPVCANVRDSASYRAYGDDLPLTTESMVWFFEQYAGDPADPDVAPAAADDADLVGLPPALVLLASHDVLADEGIEYARRLEAAGVPTTLSIYDGAIHGFVRWTDCDLCHQALDELGQALRSALD